MKKSLIVIFLLGASFTATLLLNEVSSSAKVAFLDVGQGDAVFFQTKQGHQILVDGGPDATVLSMLGEVMPFWDKTIDLVVLSHPDADHITGLVSVFERYEVESVLWTGRTKETRVFEAFMDVVTKEGAKEIIATAGQYITFGDSGAVLEILYPFLKTDIEKGASNETSIIARFVQGDSSVMLTGDTTKKIEKLVVDAGNNIQSDILKIAHHGSRTSSSIEFLEAVNPKIAVISVGKDNRYGHPTEEVLARLTEYGIKVQRTDQNGIVIINIK